jgi:hypothetical protein
MVVSITRISPPPPPSPSLPAPSISTFHIRPSGVFPIRFINLDLIYSWLNPLDGWSALSQGRYLRRTTQTQKKRRKTSMPRLEF